ncbi:hypothetical protein F2Q69_00056178 [Brassica cretica]|uniref:Uncharacterized protein n=1 Tax=Brassica cretica TaxID=69181 RepID=A0A8S9MXI9_BRACR|nr:hypothetical protein F2Q69_00056178 [Brassica cretica]
MIDSSPGVLSTDSTHSSESSVAGSIPGSVSEIFLCSKSSIHRRHCAVTPCAVASSSASSNRWLVKLCCAYLCDLSSSPTVDEPNGGRSELSNL